MAERMLAVNLRDVLGRQGGLSDAPAVVAGLSVAGARSVAARGAASVTSDSCFRIASLTKPFTSAALVRTLREHDVPLRTPAIELLPGLETDWRADPSLTVEQLLGQVSGLRESVDAATVAALGDGPDALSDAARLVVRAGNEREPGARWSYYNGNYFLAGAILAALNETSYETALTKRLLDPWHLSRTTFDNPHAPVTGWAGPTELPPAGYPRGRRPSGGLWSSVADLLALGEGMLADRALLEHTRRRRTAPDDPMAYGLGWALGPAGQIYLNGRLPGYRGAAGRRSPRTAMSCAFPGTPVARLATRPSASSTSSVGVRQMPRARTASRLLSASTSTCRTPGSRSATSPLTRRTARHGAQNADENCSSVARAGRTPSWSRRTGSIRSPAAPGSTAASRAPEPSSPATGTGPAPAKSAGATGAGPPPPTATGPPPAAEPRGADGPLGPDPDAAGTPTDRNRPSVRRRQTPATVPSASTAATTISPVVSTRPLWHAPRPAAM